MPSPEWGYWWVALAGTAIVGTLTAGLLATLLAANRRLRQERDFGETILREAPAAIIVLDAWGQILRVNDQLSRLLGCDPRALRGRSFRTIPRLNELLANFWGEGPYSGPRNCEFERQIPDSEGNPHHLSWTLTALSGPKGLPRWLVAIGIDLTETKRLERYLFEAQKLEAVGRLAGGIAHDFNNLLTAILGQCYALERHLPDPDHPARAAIQEIDRAAEKASRLTKQLLAFSRQQVLEPRPVLLNGIVSEMEEMIRRLAGESVDVSLELHPEAGLIEADPTQIERVLINLVLNARDAMPQGGRLRLVTLRCSADEAACRRVPGLRPGKYAVLVVEDTGIGMDEATLSRIFEPFFTTKPAGKGTGLGLSTVYGIVQQLGGVISVTSQPGEGTRFEIYFPQLDTATPVPVPSGEEDVPRPLQGLVLVAEDDPDVRNSAAEALRDAGLTVEVAADGPEALRKSALLGHKIDLLITDVVMPRMSGRELAERLRTFNPKLKVLYISGYAEEVIRQHGVLGKSSQLLSKPFTPRQLVRTVARVIREPVPTGSQ